MNPTYLTQSIKSPKSAHEIHEIHEIRWIYGCSRVGLCVFGGREGAAASGVQGAALVHLTPRDQARLHPAGAAPAAVHRAGGPQRELPAAVRRVLRAARPAAPRAARQPALRGRGAHLLGSLRPSVSSLFNKQRNGGDAAPNTPRDTCPPECYAPASRASPSS